MTTRARVALVIWLGLLACLFAVPVAGALYIARVPEFYCLERIQLPPSNGVDFEWNVTARTTLFPLGTECTFIRQTGQEIVVGPGWLLTVFTGASAVFAVGTIAAMVWPSRRPVT